jgi:putative hydrolase of the HAD superfamily
VVIFCSFPGSRAGSIRYNAGMVFTTLFFDLDATLYPAANGLWDQMRLRIYRYLGEKVGIPEQEIPQTRDFYWTTYGTTLEGLRIHHQVDPQEYLDFVHDLPLEVYLQPDPQLRKILMGLPQKLWVFTNSDRRHAGRVLDRIGIADLFSGIIDLFALDFAVKPNLDAFQAALRLSGRPEVSGCVLFDDLTQNLLAAKRLGFTTALVGSNGQADGIDYQLETLHDMEKVMPALWDKER